MFRIFGFGKTTPSESKGSQKGQVFPSEGGKLLSTPSTWRFLKLLTRPFYFRARRRSSREEIMGQVQVQKPKAEASKLIKKFTKSLTVEQSDRLVNILRESPENQKVITAIYKHGDWAKKALRLSPYLSDKTIEKLLLSDPPGEKTRNPISLIALHIQGGSNDIEKKAIAHLLSQLVEEGNLEHLPSKTPTIPNNLGAAITKIDTANLDLSPQRYYEVASALAKVDDKLQVTILSKSVTALQEAGGAIGKPLPKMIDSLRYLHSLGANIQDPAVIKPVMSESKKGLTLNDQTPIEHFPEGLQELQESHKLSQAINQTLETLYDDLHDATTPTMEKFIQKHRATAASAHAIAFQNNKPGIALAATAAMISGAESNLPSILKVGGRFRESNNALYQKLTDGLTAINDILHPKQAEESSYVTTAFNLISGLFYTQK